MANSLNKITTKSILDATVATADIADDAVTEAKIADASVDEARLKISNSPTNGQFLSAQSGNTGGLTWAAVSSVGGATGVDFNDTVKARFGTDNDLELWHTGSHGQLKNSTGTLQVFADNFEINNTANSEYKARFINNAAVELYYDNSKKFETTSGGAKVTGELQMGGTAGVKFSHSGTTSIYESQTAGDSLVFKTTPSGGSSTTRLTISSDGVFRIPDGDRLYLGTDHDLMLYHTGGAHSYLRNDTGQFYIQAENNIHFQHTTDGGSAESTASFNADGSVELYYDNSKKFETTSGGVQVTGNMVADAVYLGDDEKLYLGTGDDFQMWHEASSNKTIFKENGTGSFDIRGNTIQLQDAGGNENLAVFTPDGGVNLYHNNVLKFNTWAEGCKGMGIVHAMGRVDGQGTAHVDKEWGLDSFTDNSSGNYTVGFTHDLSTDNECVGIINVWPINTGGQIFGFGAVEVNSQSSADLSMRRVDNDAPSVEQGDWDNINFVIFDID